MEQTDFHWKEWRDSFRRDKKEFVSLFKKRQNEFSSHCIRPCCFRAEDGICVLPDSLKFNDCHVYIVPIVV